MLDELKRAVLAGDVEKAVQLTGKVVSEGVDAGQVLEKALITAMDQVGEEYECGDRYVPEMLISAEAMKAAMEILKPMLVESEIKAPGKVLIGTVEGDLHDIGKTLVAMMLEGAGFDVTDLGTEVTAKDFAETVRSNQSDILAMSALLTTTMVHMPEVIEALEREGLRDKVKVIVGGAPVTQAYAEKIRADGYAADAAGAVKLARRLVK